MAAISKNTEHSHLSSPSKYNNIKLPTFSEDINEFLANFNRAANFYNWDDDKKTEAHLQGNTNIWFNTTPDLQGKSYTNLTESLRQQFHSASDQWLLRQKLNERKQLPTETVAKHATFRNYQLFHTHWKKRRTTRNKKNRYQSPNPLTEPMKF